MPPHEASDRTTPPPVPAPEAVDVAAEQPPLPPGVFTEEQLAPSCQPGLPPEWTPWEPTVAPAPDSFADTGYSTDWGVLEADWIQGGEELATLPQPEITELSSVVGRGHEADVYWDYQGQTNYCGIYSVKSVLTEMYGTQIDTNEMVQRAASNGWLVYDEAGAVKGIYPEHLDDIFASYGVASHNEQGADGAWERLNAALGNDQRIVVGLDSKEFDAGTSVGDDPLSGVGADMDHFVAVTGVDYERGVVIVNDSARSAGLEVPIDLFWGAWQDSDHRMTVTDSNTPAFAGAIPPAGGQAAPDASGFAVLPMQLHAQFARQTQPA